MQNGTVEGMKPYNGEGHKFKYWCDKKENKLKLWNEKYNCTSYVPYCHWRGLP